ncbi:hypothetical protein GF382_02070 [Candidatus Falkowbacteria bacterium]|nr:hypothetical protein [Candidatus Falkowbacteria bacterium]
MKQTKPLSDNIIFLDTEFSSLDPYKGEILSIGMIKMTGEELYLEIDHEGEVDQWVFDHILPTLKKEKIDRREAAEKILEFVGPDKPYMISFVSQYDSLYLYKLLGIEKNPFFRFPFDFASMMFAAGYDPDDFNKKNRKFLIELGIDVEKYKMHNALDDAKLMREAYLEFFKK